MDLDTGVQHFQDAVDQTPSGHPGLALRLVSLGTGYLDSFQETGSTEDINTAIQHLQEAVDQTPSGHSEFARRLQILGAGYIEKFERTGNRTDLDTAIPQFQEAVDQTPSGHPELARRLHSLGIGYGDRFQQTGSITDLDTAIQHFQEAVDQTPSGHVDLALRLVSLGTGYLDRFQQTGSSPDLDTAILHFQGAVDQTPSGHSELARRLQILGAGYSDKFGRTGKRADLDTAIQHLQEAVDQTPSGHQGLARRLHTLGSGYLNRFQQIGSTTDLDIAIQHLHGAVDHTLSGHPDLARRLQSLGTGLCDRFRQTRSMTDLDTAIQHLQDAVDQTPSGHPELAQRLQSLGAGYSDRFKQTGNRTDQDTTIQHYRRAVDSSSSPIRARLQAAVRLLPCYTSIASWTEAYYVGSLAMQLVPLLAPQFLQNADKQHLLTMFAGLAVDSAAMALSASKTAFHAVQFLELGRGVISGSLGDIRTDTTDLLSSHPELGQKYINLRNILDSPEALENGNVLSSPASRPTSRYAAWKEMEKLLCNIRKKAGFETFLLPLGRKAIMRSAELGPVVVVNVSQYRCDAIIIDQHDIWSIELSKLHSKDVKERTKSGNFGSLETLEWMWDTISNPVLEALGLTQIPTDDRWPHIWWVPTGLLTKFPLHAAGLHTKTSCETVIDRVMSSYGSSIKTILHSRASRHPDTLLSVSAQALLVAVPNAPGSQPLPFATIEIEKLRGLCRSMAINPIEPGGRRSDVTLHLPKCEVFHFAGHGYTDNQDPSRSYLLLEDGRSNPLTVATLLEMNLRDHSPFLAYLSACGTGQIGDERYLDESIHLISAFQLAGFRHVIGALWEVNDEVCVDVARITYEGMRDRRMIKGHMTDESVCRSLHNAIRKLRDNWLGVKGSKRRLTDHLGARDVSHGDQRDDRLPRDGSISEEDDEGSLSWVPYVHFGV
jgi:hypothetical protein